MKFIISMFIITEFIRKKINTEHFYTSQNLYETTFSRLIFLTFYVTMFIISQFIRDKVYIQQSLQCTLRYCLQENIFLYSFACPEVDPTKISYDRP